LEREGGGSKKERGAWHQATGGEEVAGRGAGVTTLHSANGKKGEKNYKGALQTSKKLLIRRGKENTESPLPPKEVA